MNEISELCKAVLKEPSITLHQLKLAIACEKQASGNYIFELTSEIPEELFIDVLNIEDNWFSTASNKEVNAYQNEIVFSLCKIWGMLISRFKLRRDLVIDWLSRPKRPLDGKTPLLLMRTSVGCHAVVDIIERMDTGDFS